LEKEKNKQNVSENFPPIFFDFPIKWLPDPIAPKVPQPLSLLIFKLFYLTSMIFSNIFITFFAAIVLNFVNEVSIFFSPLSKRLRLGLITCFPSSLNL